MSVRRGEAFPVNLLKSNYIGQFKKGKTTLVNMRCVDYTFVHTRGCNAVMTSTDPLVLFG